MDIGENTVDDGVRGEASRTEPEPSIYNISSEPLNPLKRKNEEEGGSKYRANPFEQAFNDAYRLLLNSHIKDAVDGGADAEFGQLFSGSKRLVDTQLGLVTWTIEEKLVLFERLKTLGKDEIVGLARAIGTKSSCEVGDYLSVLEQGLHGRHQTEHPNFVQYEDLPAALEIGTSCEMLLEEAADSLAACQQAHDEIIEEKRHGELWLLDQDNMRAYEYTKRAAGESQSSTSRSESASDKKITTLDFFHARHWLELSERIFMRGMGDSQLGLQPSMYMTALQDFHNLARIITTRLVYAALFQASCRLRANDTKRQHLRKKLEVKRTDVLAAANILGLEPNPSEFWVGAARRNELQVVDFQASGAIKFERGRKWEAVQIKKSDRVMSYNEVEARLRQRSRSFSPKSENDGDEAVELTPNDMDVRPDGPQPDPEQLNKNSASRSPNPEIQTRTPAPGERQPSPPFLDIDSDDSDDSLYDRYLEDLDQRASAAEEARLWALLGEDPPSDNERADLSNIEPLKPPRARAKPNATAWRDRLRYAPEWQRFGEVLTEERFASLRRSGPGAGAGRVAEKVGHEDEPMDDDTGRVEGARRPRAGCESGTESLEESLEGSNDGEQSDADNRTGSSSDDTSDRGYRATRADRGRATSQSESQDRSRGRSLRPRRSISYALPPLLDETVAGEDANAHDDAGTTTREGMATMSRTRTT